MTDQISNGVKVDRKLHKIDASGQSVGRLASRISLILRGKNKTNYQPYLDQGDTVEVFNINKLTFSGNKLAQKKYFKYSGYPGGLKTAKASEKFINNPALILINAVKQMLPANKLRINYLKRLIIK